jgi:hypothetical protein
MRVVLITGAGRGIGLAIAQRMVRDGATVVLVDRDGQALADVGASLGAGDRVVQELADAADDEAVGALVRRLQDRFGRLDGLVNNAGTMVRKPLTALSLAEWDRVLSVNLTGPFLFAREAAPLLRATKGAIVNIASTRAHMSEPDTEAYAASKGGLTALTHALAVSLGPDIRVNAVSPGWIETTGEALREIDHHQHPAGRVGRPEDVAALVAWLLGPEAGFVTGAEFVIDGGMTRKMIYAD